MISTILYRIYDRSARAKRVQSAGLFCLRHVADFLLYDLLLVLFAFIEFRDRNLAVSTIISTRARWWLCATVLFWYLMFEFPSIVAKIRPTLFIPEISGLVSNIFSSFRLLSPNRIGIYLLKRYSSDPYY